jgi:thioredoxin reductase (NADPH)
MVFFTTPELLEIGDVPFATANQKPTRAEALEYYRKVAEKYSLDVRQYQTVLRITGSDGDFGMLTVDNNGAQREYCARKLVLAIGYYDIPNRLGVPGEDLAKVTHYYKEPHPYTNSDVVVVGAKNSAAIAALELWRHGARVTIVHRGPAMGEHVKYWIKPDIENRIKAGEIRAYFNTTVEEIAPTSVLLRTPDGELRIRNDFVLAMTGYRPDFEFLEAAGVEFIGLERRPRVNLETLESNVPGLYLAGVIVAGTRTNEIFIENGRFHGQQIAADLARKMSPRVDLAL